MAIEDNILDTEFHQSHIVENSIRFAHFIIDTITRFIVTISFVVFVGFFHNITSFNINSIACIPFFLYYPLMEYFFGKTVAKMMTKSTVVREDGGRITFIQAIIRSLCRFIPFNPFSFLGSTTIGWHDKISKTRVVNDSFFI